MLRTPQKNLPQLRTRLHQQQLRCGCRYGCGHLQLWVVRAQVRVRPRLQKLRPRLPKKPQLLQQQPQKNCYTECRYALSFPRVLGGLTFLLKKGYTDPLAEVIAPTTVFPILDACHQTHSFSKMHRPPLDQGSQCAARHIDQGSPCAAVTSTKAVSVLPSHRPRH